MLTKNRLEPWMKLVVETRKCLESAVWDMIMNPDKVKGKEK